MYEYTRPVYYYETDKMGVVHHSNYVRWLEEARNNVIGYWDVSYGWKRSYGEYAVPEGHLKTEFAFRAATGPTRVNVGNVLRDALSSSFAELENRGFTVEADIPDTPMYRHCDEEALKRVIQNLLVNACVHGQDYLRVTLHDGTVTIANKTDRLDVIDTQEIFARFYTADASRTNKRTGLGLAIAKELTQKMDGTIAATKESGLLVMRVQIGQP